MAIAVPLNEGAGPSLKQRLKHAERVNRWKAQALIAPLALFLLLVFLVPIAALLYKSVGNPEVVAGLPRTVDIITQWDGKSLPGEDVYKALSQDLAESRKNQTLGDLSKRLNMELAGYRSLLTKTARALPFKAEPASYKDALQAVDERWGDPAYWQAIRRNTSTVTSFYLLASVDHRIDDLGELAKATPDQAIYLDIFARTLWMGVVITAICLVLAYPLAYLLANLPTRQSNLLMILVLLPFWTSILVRVAAWIVLLQSGGLINSALMAMGIIDQPLELVFNRTGVYISMVHILLPFMILPLYSVMKGISPSYMRAAISLGCHPFASFWRVYFPQTYAGVGAGCLLVFILAIGYYITPALLGSPNDQMVSYFVAFYTNTSINWGMATALGGLLLLATVLLYLIYSWLVGASRLRLSFEEPCHVEPLYVARGAGLVLQPAHSLRLGSAVFDIAGAGDRAAVVQQWQLPGVPIAGLFAAVVPGFLWLGRMDACAEKQHHRRTSGHGAGHGVRHPGGHWPDPWRFPGQVTGDGAGDFTDGGTGGDHRCGQLPVLRPAGDGQQLHLADSGACGAGRAVRHHYRVGNLAGLQLQPGAGGGQPGRIAAAGLPSGDPAADCAGGDLRGAVRVCHVV
ncbi:hypothetical protein DBADOPDK_00478 [Pseudomonas sp. MM223]|nr:hypothetical protein DBADOPDK_00478 [Pseudomonas sp. MM223]